MRIACFVANASAGNDAPAIIDYLSIDTEGSEFEILKRFDFSRRFIKYMTIEHNFTPNEAALDALLEKNGFQRVLKNFSRWEAWYVSEPFDQVRPERAA